MRIAVPPSLRIVAGLLLAALLSVVGFKITAERDHRLHMELAHSKP